MPYTTVFLDVANPIVKHNQEKLTIITGPGLDMAEGSTFIKDFIAIWQQSKGRLSLQKMMAILVERQNKGANTSYGTSPTATSLKNIGLYALSPMAHRPFLGPENPVLDMQFYLRRLGFYNGSANGIYNKATDEALQRAFEQQEEPMPQSSIAIVEELRKRNLSHSAKLIPLYLFVFADPEGKFPAIKSEQEAIRQSLEKLSTERKAEVIMLNDPSREDIKRYFVDSSYRGRMAIFHFAGNEDKSGQTNGLMLNGQEVVSFNDLNNWIDYQDDLRLCFLNTCNNATLAELLTLRGVGAAIGTPSIISDDYAGDFAQQFYQNMAEGMGLEEAFNAVDAPQSGYGSHRSSAPEPSYEEPGIHRLFLNWGKAGEMREWRIAEKEEVKRSRRRAKKESPVQQQTEEAPVFEGYETSASAPNVEAAHEPQSQMGSDKSTVQLKNLITEGKTEEAIDALLQMTVQDDILKPLNRAVIALSDQYENLKKNQLSGIISYEDATASMNKIRQTILSLIDEVEIGENTDKDKKPSLWRRFLNTINFGGS
ncbi:MAG: CHAT domain-containing protein [Saprospiraceae bacterium]|nr:CHAT domain-containing protein [Saprospiraceae bacterium]